MPKLKVNTDRIQFLGHSTKPTSPVEGQVVYDKTQHGGEGSLIMWDGERWGEVSGADTHAFKYNTIITTSYVLGGYKSSAPWKNVNRMHHMTDICSNLGDQLANAGAYTSGNCSKNIGYLYSADDSWPGYGSQTVAFNMHTETQAGTGANMTLGRGDSGATFKEHYFGYIHTGGSNYSDTHNLTTNTMYSTSQYTGGFTWTETDHGSAFTHQTYGCVWDSGSHGTKSIYSTDTSAVTWTASNSSHPNWANHGQQKGISSKNGMGYAGNDGAYNGGYTLRRWQETTDTNLGAVAKPIGNCGEENLDMGQDWQYCVSQYDGLQNNRGWKFAYAVEAGYELHAGSVRTGVPGASSGHMVWKG